MPTGYPRPKSSKRVKELFKKREISIGSFEKGVVLLLKIVTPDELREMQKAFGRRPKKTKKWT